MPVPGNETHYDPNQPRVPKGYSGGGRWTRGDYAGAPYRLARDETGREPWNARVETLNPDGSVAQEHVSNRNGSQIRSRYASTNDLGWDERHAIRLPNGVAVEIEQSGDAQRIYDADGNLCPQVG